MQAMARSAGLVVGGLLAGDGLGLPARCRCLLAGDGLVVFWHPPAGDDSPPGLRSSSQSVIRFVSLPEPLGNRPVGIEELPEPRPIERSTLVPRPMLGVAAQTRAIRIQEHVEKNRNPVLIRPHMVIEEPTLPKQTCVRQLKRCRRPGLQSPDGFSNRKPLTERHQGMHVVGHDDGTAARPRPICLHRVDLVENRGGDIGRG